MEWRFVLGGLAVMVACFTLVAGAIGLLAQGAAATVHDEVNRQCVIARYDNCIQAKADTPATCRRVAEEVCR